MFTYIKTIWQNKIPGVQAGTKVNATNMNNIEEGIEKAHLKLSLKNSITIPATGWVANVGDYPLKLDFSIPDILATDQVNVDVLPDYIDVALDAELAPYVDEYAGGITFYAKSVPAEDMSAKYTRFR